MPQPSKVVPVAHGSRQREPHAHLVHLVTDSLETPSLDDREYRVVKLANDLEVLLVHDSQTDKASSALDVNVGNFSDEDDMPGMAHAVEHLLFMGTKKYPAENEYSQYLSANSGASNAYTAPCQTNYYFEVSAKPANDGEPSDSNPSPLKEALDRFAQFFIEPLFLSSTLDRELQAVDSENKKNLQSDNWRIHQVEKSLSNPNHPYCHFSTGNLETLKTGPESRGINVRDKFIEFYETHYSANRMKLVVLGREPLDVLENWVASIFTAIPNKNLAPNRWTEEVPLRQSELGIQCFVKPVFDSRELNLSFPFLDEDLLYESQPSRYVSHLIGHEGPGSIMAYTKSKGWVNGLSAGLGPVCPGSPGIFECSIRLTEEGLKHYKEIVKIFFQYIALLREAGPQEWIYEEQKGIADVDFKFKQKTSASRFTSKISSVMQMPLPREWLLSGHSRLRKFDPSSIDQAMDCLSPDNFRIFIVSQTFPGGWDHRERWYNTEYKVEKIPEDFMEEVKAAASCGVADRLSELHLPHRNLFIPTQLDVEKKDVQEPAPAPTLLRNDRIARTWWKKDDTFWVPKANLVVSCKNPIIFATAENTVKARLYTELVRDSLEEYSYDAELAGLRYNVSLDSRGLFLDLSGYSDKLPVLLEQVINTVRNIEIRDDRFEIIKERLKRGFNNWEFQASYQQIGDYMHWLNTEQDFVVEELATELPGITAEATRQFQRQLLSRMHIELFIHGNVYKEDALKLTDTLERTLRPRVLPPAQWPVNRSLILPPGSNYVYQRTLKDPANINHCIEYWLYIGDKGDREVRAKTLLLDQMFHEPAYDQLRTKEQLGYIIFSGARSFSTTYGFRVLLQSEKPPQYLHSRVEAFLDWFETYLADMGEADFESHKRSLIVRRLKKLENLDAESGRHWGQISNEYYDFEVAKKDAEQVKEVTKSDMISFYKTYISTNSSTRAKLVVELFARGGTESDEKLDELLTGLKDGSEEIRAAVRAALLDPEKRNNTKLLESHLTNDLKLSRASALAVLAASEDPSTGPKVNGTKSEDLSNGVTSAKPSPSIITDVRAFKTSLLASAGARPEKDITAYEEVGAKL